MYELVVKNVSLSQRISLNGTRHIGGQ